MNSIKSREKRRKNVQEEETRHPKPRIKTVTLSKVPNVPQYSGDMGSAQGSGISAE